MALPQIAQAALDVRPIRGPFSKYLNAVETSVLVALLNSVRPRVMMEFGCNRGTTAKRVLDNVPSIECYIGIDVPFGHKPTLHCQDSEVLPSPGYYAANDPRFFLLQREQGSLLLSPVELELIDAAFIDGDHSRAAVLRDTGTASELMRPGGIIIWHDYGNTGVEVTEVLDALHDAGRPLVHVAGTLLAYAKF